MLLLFSLLLLADGYVLIILSRVVGIYLLLAIEAVSGLAAAVAILRSYRNTVDDLRAAVDAGRDPEPELRWICCLWVSVVLLLIPGFVTDGLGIAVLIPPFRWLVARFVMRAARDGVEELLEHLKLET